MYDNVAIEISNVPLSAFVAIREDDYEEDDEDDEDDEDVMSSHGMSAADSVLLIKASNFFLLNLYNHQDQIRIKLIKP